MAPQRKGQDVVKPQNILKDTRDNKSTLARDMQLNSHNRYRQSPTINKAKKKSTTTKNNLDLPKEYKNEHVNDTYDSKLDKQEHIKDTENANSHNTPHTKPTSQPTKNGWNITNRRRRQTTCQQTNTRRHNHVALPRESDTNRSHQQ
jgi:hypothetical protein